MTDPDRWDEPGSGPVTARRRRRRWAAAVLVLPMLVLTGVLAVAWAAGTGGTCSGPVPGCASLRNAGDIPVTVSPTSTTSDGESSSATVVPPGEREVLRGTANDVRVETGQCLIVDGGPLWNARTIIDRTDAANGVWHPVDEWGARVQMHNGACPDGP